MEYVYGDREKNYELIITSLRKSTITKLGRHLTSITKGRDDKQAEQHMFLCQIGFDRKLHALRQQRKALRKLFHALYRALLVFSSRNLGN